MYIGIDCGTQGTKAIVWNEGEVIGQGYTTHTTIMDVPGKREQRPDLWLEALISSVRKAFKGIEHLKSNVKGIGVSGQQHGLVLVNAKGQVIRNALLWCDTRPHQVLSDFERSRASTFVEDIGIQVPVAFTIAKLLWIKQTEPRTFEQVRRIMLPHEYLNWALTGRYVIEAGDASGTGWFDTHSRSINQNIMEEIGLDQSFEFPEVIDSEQVVGTLTTSISEQLGLRSDVIVSTGGGDNMMAAIGTGNVGERQLTISLGTSGTLFSHCYQQVNSSNHPDLNAFCSSTNGYLPLASTMNVTTANNSILTLTNTNLSDFDTMLNASPIGSEGLLSVPFFNGARLPNVPTAKGAVLGITSNNLSAVNLLKATVEGVTYNLDRGAKTLFDAGVLFEHACVIGGGANSLAWRQMIADVLNVPLWMPKYTEAAAVGAAIQACWAYENRTNKTDIANICGEYISRDDNKIIAPISENHSKYSSLSEQYHECVDEYIQQFK